MPKFVSIRRIHQSLLALSAFTQQAQAQMVVHLWGFLSLKYKNVTTSEFTIFEESDDKAFADKFLRLNDTSEPYYEPFRNGFAPSNFYHSNMSTIRKGTIVAWGSVQKIVKNGPPKQETWRIDDSYVEEIVKRVLTKSGKIHRFPLLDVVAWILREDEFPDEVTVADAVAVFKSRFHLSDTELKTLFDWKSDDTYSRETAFFSSHSASRDLVEQAAKQKMEFDLTVSLAEVSTGGEIVDTGQVEQLLKFGRGQVILQGPPGTGKTYLAREVAAKVLGFNAADAQTLNSFLKERQYSTLLEDKESFERSLKEHGCWEIIQFHPSYTYEDFVRGISATVDEKTGNTQFHIFDRTFGALAKCSTMTDQPVVLIVDEINRGDLSKVLGELVYALEYRDQAVRTPYEVNGSALLTVGKNLLIIATMNTADRSIALIDYAIRRRFDFVDIQSSEALLATLLEKGALKEFAPRILMLYRAVANLSGLNEDYAVGHTYFLGDDVEQVARRMIFQVLPLLTEYQKEGLINAETHITLDGWLGETGLPLTHSKPFELAEELVDWLSVKEAIPSLSVAGDTEDHDDASKASN